MNRRVQETKSKLLVTIVPGCDVVAGGEQHVTSEGMDGVRLLRDGDELDGVDGPELGMGPSGESFDAHSPSGGCVDDWLVGDPEVMT